MDCSLGFNNVRNTTSDKIPLFWLSKQLTIDRTIHRALISKFEGSKLISFPLNCQNLNFPLQELCLIFSSFPMQELCSFCERQFYRDQQWERFKTDTRRPSPQFTIIEENTSQCFGFVLLVTTLQIPAHLCDDIKRGKQLWMLLKLKIF